ncbi:golgin subfamily a member 3 [Plakobranchus ocellatus]|uniref:Golgin subfamily a member 3 n=1 Tax=Plakobranchus ocellatus TaxID=259542 RepID=A0AAV3YRN2_9GAST|nr:golgin subfamily a member 3 [Plakobranchus ocellatus]
MEPFNLTLSPVNPAENDSFDSFNNVVNYETNFGPSDQSLPLSSYNINTVEYTWTDYTYPTSTTIQTTQGGTPVRQSASPVIPYQPVWCDLHERGSPPHRSFLVHHDDSLEDSLDKRQSTDRVFVTKEQLNVLAQVTSNTAAVAKSNRRQQRFIAKTVTSPSTPIPPPGRMSSQPESGDGSQDGSDGGDDNSFETVAEALRLQWSVIGNKQLSPAGPDIVAQVVAQATGKMKMEATSPTSLVTSTPWSPSTPTTMNSAVPREPNTPSDIPSTSASHLIRIIPTEISTERGKQSSPSWFSTGTKGIETVSANTLNSASPAVVSKVAQSPTSSPSATDERQQDIKINLEPQSFPAPQNANVSQTKSLPGLSQSNHDANINGGKRDASDSVSEASYSSDMEMAKYIDNPLAAAGLQSNYELESEEFLKSLPPIKPINLDAYAAVPLLPPLPPKTSERKPKSLAKSLAKRATGSPTHKTGSKTNPKPVPTSTNTAVLEQAQPESNDPSVRVAGGATDPSHGYSGNLSNSATPPDVASSPGANTAVSEVGATNKKQMEEILKEKAKLQGQVEILTQESQTVLQERAELHAQLATLKAKLGSAGESGDKVSDANLRKEVDNLRDSRKLLEQTVLDANRLLAEKVEEIRTLQDELQLAQDASTKLQVRTQEMRDEIRSRDMNVQALKNKIAELYVEVQTSIQAKMEADTEARTARNDLASLLKAKEWYQEQLQAAHDVRAKLQRELTLLQGQGISHGAVVERLKTESARLRQQLAESQQRALRDKEMLAKHLERIQGDMMEREAAFLEIQRERKLFEDTFNSQVTTAEEEKSRLAGLQQATSDLEAQLQRAQSEATKRHDQLVQMETGQMDVMKRLAVAEEGLGEKEKALAEMEQKLIQVESQLQAVMSDLTKKDNEILTLKEEKASTEIALKSALLEKSSVDKALDILKADMGKVELSFKQMKHELSVRVAELEQAKLDKEKLQESLDCSQHELEIKTRSIDSMTRTFDGQSAAQHDMATERDALQKEVDVLRMKVQNLEFDLRQKDENLASKVENIDQLTSKVQEMEAKLTVAQESMPAEKVEQYESERENLREKIRALEEREAELGEQRETEKGHMREEVEKLRLELMDRQKAYEENLNAMDKKLKELMSDRQQLETELGIARRSEELSQIEEREAFAEEIQGLAKDLNLAKEEKSDLEQRLETVQKAKADEISNLLQKLESQSEALAALQSQQAVFQQTEAANQNLELELEKERGRVIGLSQTTTELKEHSRQLETALAQRESALEELKRSVEESHSELQQRDQALLQRVADLEAAVEKEVTVQKDLRKQMGSKIMENKRLKKQCDGAGAELEQLRQDLAESQRTATQTAADLDQLRQLHLQVKGRDEEESRQLKDLQSQLEAVSGRLEESLAKEPLLMEQIQSLEWQYAQVCRELEAARDQFKQVEERAQEEATAAKLSLQDKQSEIDSLQAELTALRQEKMHQRSQVNELRGTLQASVQHHKLTKRLNSVEANDVGVQADTGRKIVIPPLPFDLAAVEQLLQNTRVKPLESRPLDQLSDCLSSLRAEITGLQKQMDLHTSAVNSSTQSWKTVQSGVNELNEVMKTIANTIIAANTSQTLTMTAAVEREQTDIFNV